MTRSQVSAVQGKVMRLQMSPHVQWSEGLTLGTEQGIQRGAAAQDGLELVFRGTQGGWSEAAVSRRDDHEEGI